MDIANKTGGIVIGTGDLSELALGWATYNGDHMSMYGVNAGVPKSIPVKPSRKGLLCYPQYLLGRKSAPHHIVLSGRSFTGLGIDKTRVMVYTVCKESAPR